MNDLRLASTIKLYNPPKVKKRVCNSRKNNESTLNQMIKSLKSGWNIDLF